jgi:pimeloyl-ACP methyl ester carboxylesterase
LSRIEQPVLMINGSQSPAHLGRRTAALAAVLPHGCQVSVTGQGHGAYQGDPAVLAAAITAFVDALMRR